MAQYQISEKTRVALINAAGELIARDGEGAVTTRAIAEKAGCVQNAITYHFGGIHGLIDAVWNYVLEEWHPESVGNFIRAELSQSLDDAAKSRLVTECVHRIFDILYRPEQPQWISKFLVRSALSPEGAEHVARAISGKVAPALIELFLALTGDDDREAARCWSLRILAAPVVFTANLTQYAKFRDGRGVNRKLYRKLEQVTVREALFAAGLPVLPETAEEKFGKDVLR